MKKRIQNLGWVLLLLAAVRPAFAGHGSLATNARDSWINDSVRALVAEGWITDPGKPAAELTNLEVARLTAKAGTMVVAQLDLPLPPPPGQDPALPAANSPAAQPAASPYAGGTENIKRLVEEFKHELSAMDVDVAKLEGQIFEQERRNKEFAFLQKHHLKRTGAMVEGYSRGYINTYRGFGRNAFYSPMEYNSAMLADIHLKSVPVPFTLFNATLRMARTIGLYYADPISPNISLRWLSLENENEIANLKAGDFYKNYTPLTLWNAEIPAYTFLEPTSYKRVRNDVEELVFMDKGPQWRLRGFEVLADHTLKDSPISSYLLQVMAGELRSATAFGFADEYAGAQAGASFADDNIGFKGTGLVLMNDKATANVPYIPNLTTTYVKQYMVGSLGARAKAPVSPDFSVGSDVEWAVSRYQDDANNAASVLQDWALIANGSVSFMGAQLTLKYLNNGAYFYSPGAQTNRFSNSAGMIGYISTNMNLDNQLLGYRDRYVFQGVGRPVFAAYSRLSENFLPYGEASPNREGFILGFNGELGKDGWLKPRASYLLKCREFQPNYVLNAPGTAMLPVDSTVATTTARAFGGWEASLVMDLAKAFDGFLGTCSVGGEYKQQKTEWSTSSVLAGPPAEGPFTVNTMIFCADAGPFPGVPLFEGLILSAAYQQTQSTGSEYGFSTAPATAQYGAYFDSSQMGSYSYFALNTLRTTWAFGVKLPLSKTFDVHADWFIDEQKWNDYQTYFPGAGEFDQRTQIWRLTYEVSF